MKDNFFWPGFILLGFAFFGIIGAVVVGAYQHYEWLTATVLVAILGTTAAALWFVIELRHVTQLEEQGHFPATTRLRPATESTSPNS